MARPKSATVDLKVRMKEPLRAEIEAAAKDRGVSLNAEAVALMEQALQEREALGGRECYALFRMMGAAANLIEGRTGKSAASDWETSFAVREAWKKLIASWSPKMPQTLGAKFRALDEGQRSLPPTPPPPKEPLLLLGPSSMQNGKEARAEYKKARAKYAKDIQKWMRSLRAHQKKLEKLQKYFEGLAEIGREVALDLLPSRDR